MRRVAASVLCAAGLVALTSPASAGDGELTKQDAKRYGFESCGSTS